MNYGELKSQFTGLLNRRDVTAAQIVIFIDQAISRVQRQLRVPALEKGVVITMVSYAGGVSVPSDLLEVKDIFANEYRLRRADLTSVLSLETIPGQPRVFTRVAADFRFGPYPEAGTVIRIDYYAEAEALVADADENVLSIIAPDLLVYGALSYACDFFLDDRASLFESRFKNILAELQDQSDRDELSGGAAVSATYEYPSDE